MKFRFAIGAAIIAAILCLDVAAFAQAGWTQRFPATSPSRRFQTSMAQFNSFTLLFGGNPPSFPTTLPLDDTWLWDGTNWTQITRFGFFGTGPHPPARSRAAIAYDPENDQVVMFGGDGGFANTLGDTWIFRRTFNALLNRSALSWGQPALSEAPPARSFAVMEYDPALKKMILTGGISSSGQSFQDTWAFDPNTLTWDQLSTAHAVSPTRRATAMAKCGAAIAIFGFQRQVSPTELLLFGGGNDLGDSWRFGGTTSPDWTGPLSPSPDPDGRGD